MKFAPQVRVLAPAELAVSHHVVGQAVEGHLLDVEVPVEQEPPPVHHQEGQEDEEGKPQAQEKGLEEIVVPPAAAGFLFDRMFHKAGDLRR